MAMEKELSQLVSLLEGAREESWDGTRYVLGRMGGVDVVATGCGIGKVCAAVGAWSLIERYCPMAVVSTGVAGGAWTGLRVGDVVVGTEYAYHDAYCGEGCAYGQLQGMPARYEADGGLLSALRGVDVGGTRLHMGLTVTGDWFVDSREKMREILGHFPSALAVDMESAAIAQACYLRGVPFVSLRIISDVPLSDEKGAQYFDFWERLADTSFGVTRALIGGLDACD